MENEEKRGNIGLEELQLIILNSLPIPATVEGKTKQLIDTYGLENYSKAVKELLDKKFLTVKDVEGKPQLVITDDGKKFLEEVGRTVIRKFITEDGIRGLFGEVVKTPTEEEFIDKIINYFKNLEMDIEEKYEDVYTVWNTLPISKLEIVKVGDEELYEFEIWGKKLRIDGSKILSPSAFVWAFFKEFGVILPSLPKKVWHYILTKWKTTLAKFTKEKFTDEDIIRDIILNYVNDCLVTHDIKLSLNEGVVYVEKDEGKVYVPNTMIRRLLERERIKVSLRRLAEILKDYKFPNELRRIGGKKRVYFWVFRLDKLNLDLSKVVESEEQQKSLKGEGG